MSDQVILQLSCDSVGQFGCRGLQWCKLSGGGFGIVLLEFDTSVDDVVSVRIMFLVNAIMPDIFILQSKGED